MVDHERRKKLAFHLRQLSVWLITNDAFEEAEEKALPPFDEAVWENGNYPFNGDILDQRIDEIL